MSDSAILTFSPGEWNIYECSTCKGRFCFENMVDTVEITHPAFCPICGRSVDQVLRAE